jgi:UDP-N-acetylglucosamine 1-carboxyvinyltransferase
MEKLVIKGGNLLNGNVTISGAKNAAVAIIPAAILANGVCVIDNLPEISDVENFMEALTNLGAVCELVNETTLRVDSTNINSYNATFSAVAKMRASYYLMGALLARFKRAEVALPGGCNFGSRPINLHLAGFRALGAEVVETETRVSIKADKLVGAKIYLDTASVGATINIMLAATRAEGTTIIENAAREPHIVDTANFLNMLGAKIKGAGTDTIRITGVEEIHGGEYTIIPDQIEAGTYMLAVAATGGDVTVNNIIPKHMESLSAKLREMGCIVFDGDDNIRVISNGKLMATNVKTMAYPGFPTDLQPQMAAALCKARGTSILTENVWDNRFQYIKELVKFGCDIYVEGRSAKIVGRDVLHGADVLATDLRAGAAMVIAALASEGETHIGNTQFIYRGYEKIEDKLRALGAQVSRIDD